jgi:hypothetical protein
VQVHFAGEELLFLILVLENFEFQLPPAITLGKNLLLAPCI